MYPTEKNISIINIELDPKANHNMLHVDRQKIWSVDAVWVMND